MNTKDTTIGYALGYNKGYALGKNSVPPQPIPVEAVVWAGVLELQVYDVSTQLVRQIEEVKYYLNLDKVTELDLHNYETGNTRGYIEYA